MLYILLLLWVLIVLLAIVLWRLEQRVRRLENRVIELKWSVTFRDDKPTDRMILHLLYHDYEK